MGAADVHADFLERAFLEKCRQPLARRHLPLFVTGARFVFAAAFDYLDPDVPGNPQGPLHPAS
jgi:hypothetical protein